MKDLSKVVTSTTSGIFNLARNNATAAIAITIIALLAFALHLAHGLAKAQTNNFPQFAAVIGMVLIVAIAVLIVVVKHSEKHKTP